MTISRSGNDCQYVIDDEHSADFSHKTNMKLQHTSEIRLGQAGAVENRDEHAPDERVRHRRGSIVMV